MKKIFAFLIASITIISCGNNSKIGKYTKEELPSDFTYTITKDESDERLEKNQLQVELNQKLTVGQIATLAEELYNSKDKQSRFYIFYALKGHKNSIVCWANSDFDPELEIEINGSTINQDNKMLDEAKIVNGKIIGVYNEQDYTFATYTVYEKNNQTIIKNIFKDGTSMDSEMKKSITKDGTRFDYKNEESNGEYFILTRDNNLEFYNKKNEKFTTGYVIK